MGMQAWNTNTAHVSGGQVLRFFRHKLGSSLSLTHTHKQLQSIFRINMNLQEFAHKRAKKLAFRHPHGRHWNASSFVKKKKFICLQNII